MVKVLLVGFGGFAGSVCRYLGGLLAYRVAGNPDFPVGTLAVNLGGCFIIGLLGQLGENRIPFSPDLRMLLFVGFLGGFTTFSSFSYETVVLLRGAKYAAAFGNVALQLVGGLCAVALGMATAKAVP